MSEINKLAIDFHKEAFTILLEELKSLGIKHYLIGAAARDIQLAQVGIKPNRGTQDIDFAVMVDSMDQYDGLMDSLKSKGFQGVDLPFRLVWNDGESVIDLLPYGEVEENYTVDFNERKIELSVLGMKEVGDISEPVDIDVGDLISVPVPPVHGIFLLKLISWSDRPEGRDKDLDDLSHIILNYWEIISDEAYKDHLDLFDGNFDLITAGSRILGRKLNEITVDKLHLHERIEKVLSEQSASDAPGSFPKAMAVKHSITFEEATNYVSLILKGLLEGKTG